MIKTKNSMHEFFIFYDKSFYKNILLEIIYFFIIAKNENWKNENEKYNIWYTWQL